MEPEENESLFDLLPPELFEHIFRYLSVPNLKSCQSVSSTWNENLVLSRCLRDKSVIVWRASTSSRTWEFVNRKLPRSNDSLQLIQFDLMQILLMEKFKDFTEFDAIKELELKKVVDIRYLNGVSLSYNVASNSCQLLKISLICKGMKNLTKLTITDLYQYDRRSDEPDFTSSIVKLPTVKELNVRLDPILLQLFNKVDYMTKIGDMCENLEKFSFRVRLPSYNPNNHSSSLNALPYSAPLKVFVDMMHSTSTKLKEVELILDKPKIERSLFEENTGIEEGIQHFVFKIFLSQLNRYNDWSTCGLRLKSLKLSFRVILLKEREIQNIFLPFLQTQNQLERFCLGGVYLSQNPAGLQAIFDNLPAACNVGLKGPGKISSPPPETRNTHGVGVDVSGNSIYEEALPSGSLRNNNGSSAFLKTQNFSVQINNPNWSYENFVGATEMSQLTKIRICQDGVEFQNKIILRDAEIQQIIRNGKTLTELTLKYCNLGSVSDSGLTGISPVAIQRMRLDNDYALDKEDLTGLPISALKNLRCLMLGDVGEEVTDVSAYHAFNGLASLSKFGIQQSKMTLSGLATIQNLFRFNQHIQIDMVSNRGNESLVLRRGVKPN